MSRVTRSRSAASKPSTRAEQKASTREQIRAAAWELFTTVGYEATTTKAIAAKARVAAGTVFVHASDKEDLLHLVMHDRLREVLERQFESVPEGPLVERLLHVFGGFFRSYAQHPGVAAAFVRSIPRSAGPNARRMTDLTIAYLHRIGGLVVEAQRRGEVAADLPPLLAAQSLFALYFAALLAWLNGQATLEGALEGHLRAMLELAMRGLRAPSASAAAAPSPASGRRSAG